MVSLTHVYDINRELTDTKETIVRSLGKLKEFWQEYKRSRAAVFGLAIVLAFILIAILAPLLTTYSPWSMAGEPFEPPSFNHVMGTDDLGRDILSQVVYGSRLSLMVGSLAAGTSTVIGILVGTVAGYFGGLVDDFLMRVTEAFQVIPRFFLAMVMVAIFGGNILNLILVIGILSWPTISRVVRAEFLSLKEREFVEAVRILRVRSSHIIFKEILPNALPPVIVSASLEVAGAILLEAGLSFLGLGDPNLISWGYMLNNAQRFIRHGWWLTVFPGIGISSLSLGLALIGDGLNYSLNPKLKRR